MALKRNLYFYLYPVRDHHNVPTPWAWNVAQLKERLNVFNGRKIIVIAVDTRTETADHVQSRFPPDSGIEFIVVENDAIIGETAPFLRVLSMLKSQDPREITFYAHGKGVTKPSYEVGPVLAWAQMMYELNLTHPEVIEHLMEVFDAVGCLRIEGHFRPAAYVFGGNYFWFKHSALFRSQWEDIWRDYYGVERYIGSHIPLARSFSLTPVIHDKYNFYRETLPAGTLRRWVAQLGSLTREQIGEKNCVPWD